MTFTSTAINENGTSKRKGIEITGSTTLSQNLSLNGNYTYLDAVQPNGSGAQEREVRRPKHIANLNLNYEFSDNRTNINLNVNYNGKQKDLFFSPPFFTKETVDLNSFTLVDIAGSYKLSDLLTFYGRIENLLDDRYEEVLGFQGTGLGVYAGVKINIKP